MSQRNSEASFYGTGSMSPTTDDIRSFSKRHSDLKAEDTHKNDTLFAPKIPTTDVIQKPKDVSVKIQKGIQFTVQKVSTGKTLSVGSIARRSCYVLLGVIIALVVVSFFVMYVIIPLVFSTNLSMRRRLMFVGWLRTAPSELQTPTLIGLRCSQYLPIDGDGTIAAWYIPPRTNLPCDKIIPFGISRPAILIVPTIEETRANPNTIALVNILSQTINVHVVIFDYRGSADSSDTLPSATTLHLDSAHAYKFVSTSMIAANNTENLIIWGNSWGAPIALQTVQEIKPNVHQFIKLILQSPVESTAKSAITGLAFHSLWRWMPFFVKAFIEPLLQNEETNLNSMKAIAKGIHVPVLIIHAQDDDIISIDQGRNIYDEIRKTVKHRMPVRMYEIPESDNVGHIVNRAPKFIEQVSTFVDIEMIITTKQTRFRPTRRRATTTTSPTTTTQMLTYPYERETTRYFIRKERENPHPKLGTDYKHCNHFKYNYTTENQDDEMSINDRGKIDYQF